MAEKDVEAGCRVFLGKTELQMLLRNLASGSVSGNVDVVKPFEGKIGRALKALVEQEAETIEHGEVGPDYTFGVPESAARAVEGRADRAESNPPERKQPLADAGLDTHWRGTGGLRT